MENTEIFKIVLGQIARHFLSIAAAALAAYGVSESQQGQLVEATVSLVIAAVLFLVSQGWAYASKWLAVHSDPPSATPPDPESSKSSNTFQMIGVLFLAPVIALSLTACPSKAKIDETIRDFKNHSASLKIYGRNLQIAFNESEAAGDLTKPQLKVLTAGSKKFRDALNKLSAGIRAAETFVANGGEKRSALDTLEQLLREDVIKAFDELAETITGHAVLGETAGAWISMVRVAFAAMRVLFASAHMQLGGQNV